MSVGVFIADDGAEEEEEGGNGVAGEAEDVEREVVEREAGDGFAGVV